ncbi:MAG: signal peptidase I [Spirochaetales bacterium]|nr:hypothetical protein [Leptospiraceae bacterium]MCP5480334.1 signal peptidase I [Spirochaetales bacterium]
MGVFTYILLFLVLLAVAAVVVGMWMIFEKAGRPGWKALIPVYNLIILLDIIGRPRWWIVFYLLIISAPIAALINAIDLGTRFGQERGWGVIWLWLLSFVGYPRLAFGPYIYAPPPGEA